MNFTLSRDGDDQGGLADIEKYVAMVFESRALSFDLRISSADKLLAVAISRMLQGRSRAHVYVHEGTDHEKAVRAFFARHDFPIPDTEMPPQFFPGVPFYPNYDIAPVPPDASQLARVVADLFRGVCGLADDSSLRFVYQEFTEAA